MLPLSTSTLRGEGVCLKVVKKMLGKFADRGLQNPENVVDILYGRPPSLYDIFKNMSNDGLETTPIVKCV